jgi:hypothetical protein
MAIYKITALPAAVAAVQAVPLSWSPFIGAAVWGPGTPDAVSFFPRVLDPSGSVRWGVADTEFYDSVRDTGFNDGSTWTAARAIAVLTAMPSVTVVTLP